MSLFGPAPDEHRAARGLELVRIATAILILIHGAFRALNEGYVPGFGEWLETQGFPHGLYWAWAVTIYELIAPLFILARRFVSLACLGHILILSLGAYLVHFPSGWFVVGAGRNGMEYSVLLIVALLATAFAYAPARRKVAA
ncbi:MAG: DoxX family protein [Hydrogenophilaceae bacterium]|jgi:putative oxidoreductase|nr:DoxX family protein [Hydrogenophilaceae bacterium]